METVQVGILAVLISLSSWLHDGLKSYEAKKYDDAITKLTKVIEKDVPQNRYRDVALFYRAKSYEAKKDKKKALADLLVLIQKFPASCLSKESIALYKKMGGDMAKILPADTPKKVWNKFIGFAQAGDVKSCMKISTGMWKDTVLKEAGNDPDELRKEFSREEIIVGEETIGKGKNRGTATLELTADHGISITMEFVLDPKTNTWLIKGFDRMKMMQEAEARMQIEMGGDMAMDIEPVEVQRRSPRTSRNNVNNLKQIGLACRMYSNVFSENYPPNLNALKTEGFLENDAVYLWTNPKRPKEQKTFIYCPGFTEADSVDIILAAAPKAVNGKRECLWLDGHVKVISDKEFLAQAKKQKWKVKGSMKKEEVPEKIKKKVLALIEQLGDNDAKVRKNAKAELKKIEDQAYPILEENLNHKDPEIKMNIKEILEGE